MNAITFFSFFYMTDSCVKEHDFFLPFFNKVMGSHTSKSRKTCAFTSYMDDPVICFFSFFFHCTTVPFSGLPDRT
jgi:hypothetical protein